MRYNVEKLHEELVAAGVPVQGVSSDGTIAYAQGVTSAQHETARAVLVAHDPKKTELQKLASVVLPPRAAAALVLRLSDRWATLGATRRTKVMELINESADKIVAALEEGQ